MIAGTALRPDKRCDRSGVYELCAKCRRGRSPNHFGDLHRSKHSSNDSGKFLNSVEVGACGAKTESVPIA
jgi:hypothetical protein